MAKPSKKPGPAVRAPAPPPEAVPDVAEMAPLILSDVAAAKAAAKFMFSDVVAAKAAANQLGATFVMDSTKAPEPPEPPKYVVTPKGVSDGVAIHGADPTMQKAYRKFIKEGLGMADYVPVSIPQGMGRLVSPLSMKFAADLLGCLSEMVSGGAARRVVCIVRRDEIESNPLRHLLSVPTGKDIATHALSLGRSLLKKKLGMDVEMYLAQVGADGEVKFFRLDE